MENRRFSSRQITLMVVAGCLALVLLPWGAVAAGKQLVTITGPGGHRAAVSEDGALKVAAKPLLPGKPFQLTGSNNAGDIQVAGHGKVAFTDVVLSQDNTGDTRLNATVVVYAGNDDCSALTEILGYLVNYGYFPVEEVTAVDLTTPLVVNAPTVCLKVSMGNNAGLIANWTVGGYQL